MVMCSMRLLLLLLLSVHSAPTLERKSSLAVSNKVYTRALATEFTVAIVKGSEGRGGARGENHHDSALVVARSFIHQNTSHSETGGERSRHSKCV